MLNKKLITTLLVVFAFAAGSLPLQAANDKDKDSKRLEKLIDKLERKENVMAFDDAEIIFEQNATDGDVEVVIFAKLEESDAGMQQFWLYGPNGKVVYEFTSPKKGNNIGGREVVVESPEPADLTIVKNAYPEGTYTFIATSFDKDWFVSTAYLSHELPDVSITFPVADTEVSVWAFDVTWEAITDSTEKFIVELVNEDSDLEEELLVDIPADRNSFRAPEDWMVAGSEYQVVVGIVNEFGNKTFREINVMATE